jgi:hypothetical protein
MGRAGALLVVITMAGACTFLHPRQDGESCEAHDECESESCASGICAFSSCEHQGNCEAGFTCDEPPSWLEVLSFGVAKGVCRPSCAICPHEQEPRWSCDVAENACYYDASPWVDAGGPYVAAVGEPVVLEGTVELAPGRSMARLWWVHADTELGTQPRIEAVFDTAGLQHVSFLVEDDSGSLSSTTAEVDVCGPQGAACGYGSCCGDLECRDDDGDGELACALPPVCGDGAVEGDEECDGSPVDDLDCTELGTYHPAPVGCTATCTLDMAACNRCGVTWDGCSEHTDCCDGYECDDFFEECMPID